MKKNQTAYSLINPQLDNLGEKIKEILGNKVFTYSGSKGTIWAGLEYQYIGHRVVKESSKIIFDFRILGTNNEEVFYIKDLPRLRCIKESKLGES